MADFNIASSLRKVEQELASDIAVVEPDGGCYSFAQVGERRDSFSARLSGSGIKPGCRVMLMVPPSMDFIALTFALFELGGVVILIDPGMGYRNLLRCIAGVKPEFLISVPKGIIFSRIFPEPFKTVSTRFCLNSSLFGLAKNIKNLPEKDSNSPFMAQKDDLAAIIFTTGSTGPPKGVRYPHSVFHSQLELISSYYQVAPGEVDQPAFPLFGLFSVALGATVVIPDMNPSRPAKVNPRRFIASIIKENVTYSFGSPTIWKIVGDYCLANNITLSGLKRILMAGAPVSGDLIKEVMEILPEEADIHVPYGATESLPVTSITGREVLSGCWQQTVQGKGVCVGRSLPGIEVRIMKAVSGPVDWQEVEELETGEMGEIIVAGAIVTPAYDGNDNETGLAKIKQGNRLWHRMGDVGYLDGQGRLWYCGRKAHQIDTGQEVIQSVCGEEIFNVHPGVFRSALVGLGEPGRQTPVLLVEKKKGWQSDSLLSELQEMAGKNEVTRNIKHFMVHPGFPVDIRHNAKIFREKLVPWAERRLWGCSKGL